MDMWAKTNAEITKVANKIYSKAGHVIEVQRASGLWSSVKMSNGNWFNVYEWMMS
jgi:hypothetical protein